MTPEQITRLLDELGQRLGPAGQHVFELAVRQLYINAALYLILAVALVGIGIWTWRFGSKYESAVAPILGGLSVVTGLFIVWIQFSYLLNPEYAALSDLLSKINPGG